MNARVYQELITGVERLPAPRTTRPAAVERTCRQPNVTVKPPVSSRSPPTRVRRPAAEAVILPTRPGVADVNRLHVRDQLGAAVERLAAASGPQAAVCRCDGS